MQIPNPLRGAFRYSMYVFLGDSVLANLHDDVLNTVLANECYLNVSQSGLCLRDLAQSLAKDTFSLANNSLIQNNTGTVNFIIAIGTNDMPSFPSVLSREIMHKALLTLIGKVRTISCTARLSFIGLASRPCIIHPQGIAVESIVDTRCRKKRKLGSGTCHACSRRSFNSTFDELLSSLAAECDFIYCHHPQMLGKFGTGKI